MLAIAVELLAGRYTAMRFNERNAAEWPPHPARLFSAMVATWADSDTPSDRERAALRWLEQQQPPSLTCSEVVRQRSVTTHYVPVNDATALRRDLSGTYQLMAQAGAALAAAEQAGDARQVERARRALVKAEAKAVTDGAGAGTPAVQESPQVIASVLAMLPEHRGRQGRTYPTVLPDDPTVWLVWPDTEPGEADRQALDGLLARVGRLGHSSTMVACRVADGPPPPPSLVPVGDSGDHRLRVPRDGLLDRLVQAHASHRGTEPRTLPAGMSGYRPPGAAARPRVTPLLGGDWYVLGLAGGHLPLVGRTLAIARTVRGALMKHGDQPPSELVSGHRSAADRQPSSTDGQRGKPLQRPHLAVVPLPSIGHRYSDGAVQAVALVLPTGSGEDERAALQRAVRGWEQAGFKLVIPGRPGSRPLELTMEELGYDRTAADTPGWLDTTLPAQRRTTTRSYWCRPARRWRSVTPIALDRFPGDLRSRDARRRDRAEAEAEASVARACRLAGLPEPAEVLIRLDFPLAGVPAPLGRPGGGHRFPPYRTGSGEPRVSVHAELTFTEPVPGPMLVGAGRYFGYGLCLPEPRKDRP